MAPADVSPPPALAGLPVLNPAGFTHCFVCGADNAHGLRLRIHADGHDAVAVHTPRPHEEGWPGVVHGGLVGLLVDEMLVYAGAPHGLWAMTARVGYRLHRPMAPGTPVAMRSRMGRRSGRGFRAEVWLWSGGALAASGEGTCMLVDGDARAAAV